MTHRVMVLLSVTFLSIRFIRRKVMSEKARKRTPKKRLALPATLAKNLEDARKNLRVVQTKGVKEVEKLVHKVIEIDFVEKVRRHDMVVRATKAGNELSKGFELRFRDLQKRI